MRIAIFVNSKSQYDVLGHFTEEFKKSLCRLKIDAMFYDTTKVSEAEILADFVKTKPDFTFGFNFLISEHSFLEPLEIPHIAVMVDSATYYPQLINAPHTLACFVEADSCKFIQHFGLTKTLFFPHAIEPSLVSADIQEELKNAKRDYEVTLTASYIDPDAIYSAWKETFSETTVAFFDEVVEETLESKGLCHFFCFLQKLQLKPDVANEIKDKELPIFDLINSVEKMIRARDKIRLVKALNGFEVHIFGHKQEEARWRAAVSGKNSIIFHQQVPFKELFSVYKRSKVVINSMPTIKHGFHERLLCALAAGASVLTNENEFMLPLFPNNLATSYFLAPKYAAIPKKVEQLLASETMRLQDVLEARNTIAKQHTWDARAKLLKELITPVVTHHK